MIVDRCSCLDPGSQSSQLFNRPIKRRFCQLVTPVSGCALCRDRLAEQSLLQVPPFQIEPVAEVRQFRTI
jgi:hypothetical protein